MTNNYRNNKNKGLLDRVRHRNGIYELKAHFNDLLNSNPQKAVQLLNSEDLLFPTLFMLQSDIKKYDIHSRMNLRNKCALEIVNAILTRNTSEPGQLSWLYREENYPVLRWILVTGYMDDGLNEQYDEVLEVAAAILVKVFKDKTCLPPIEEMVFNRHRKGLFVYDLIWAFFESSEPDCLTMVANRLRSSNNKDVELAQRLLSFIPGISPDSKEDSMKQYQRCRNWLDQNQYFLYYTGENFLQTSTPCRYSVSLEAKYLQKPVLDSSLPAARSINEAERTLMNGFKELDQASKTLLSDFSHNLYRKNKKQWGKWLHYPVAKQIEIARKMSGGLQ